MVLLSYIAGGLGEVEWDADCFICDALPAEGDLPLVLEPMVRARQRVLLFVERVAVQLQR